MNEPDIAPLARRLAEENNVDWRRLPGSGEGGRVVERDVLTFLARVMAGEEDLDPTPEPVPDGMAAWPADDVAAYRAGPPGGSMAERSTTATLDDDDLFLFDDEPAPAGSHTPPAAHGDHGDRGAEHASDPSHGVFASLDEDDDDGVLLVEDEAADVDEPEITTPDLDAFTFDDEPPTVRPRTTVSNDATLPDVFADAGAGAGDRDDEMLFLDDPLDVDAPASAGPGTASARPREPWAAWDGEAEDAFTGDGVPEDRGAETARADGASDDVWAREDGPTVPTEPSEGSFGRMAAWARPTGNGEAGAEGFEAHAGHTDAEEREVDAGAASTAHRPDEVPGDVPAVTRSRDTAWVEAVSNRHVALVRHGQLWRRRFDDRAFRATVSQVADALEASPASVAEVLLARAAAAAWKVTGVDAWRWTPEGVSRHALASNGSLRDAVAVAEALETAPTDGPAALVVADLASIDLDEAVVHLDVPLLAVGRAAQDGAWLTLSGDDVPPEAVAALAAVAEALKSPVRLLL